MKLKTKRIQGYACSFCMKTADQYFLVCSDDSHNAICTICDGCLAQIKQQPASNPQNQAKTDVFVRNKHVSLPDYVTEPSENAIKRD